MRYNIHPLYFQVKRAKFIVFIPILVVCAVNCHFFWTVSLNPFNGKVECIANPAFIYLVDEVWPWVDAALYSFCPFFIITVLNCFIVKQVWLAKRRREMYLQNKCNRGIPRTRSRGTEASTRLTLMLLTVSFTFLLTTLPMNIVLILAQFWNNTPQQGLQKSATFILVKHVTELLMYVNHTINFFLYCATGKKFRKILMDLLCNRGICGKNVEVGQTVINTRCSIKLTNYGSDQSSRIGHHSL